MGLLKKIFAWHDSSSKKSGRDLRPREPRLFLTDKRQVSFRAVLSQGEISVPLANISSQGMALRRSGAPEMELDQEVQGVLNINGRDFDVRARVRHFADQQIGCVFTELPSDFARAVHDYLRVEILALKLNPVAEAFLKVDPRGQVHWFTDGRQNEVYGVTDADGVIEFHAFFLGNYVEGGRGKVLRCGYVREDRRQEPGYKASALVDTLGEVSGEMVELAQALVMNVGAMSPELKKNLVQSLSL